MAKRLLEDYPSDKLRVLTGSYFFKLSLPEERIKCPYAVFPTLSETGRRGVGRIKFLINWLLIPLLTLAGVWLIKRRNLKVILTIAHGHFFIAAALTSLITKTPLVIIVHDDWVSELQETSYLMKYFCHDLFRFTIKRAAYLYAVSPGMQEMLKSDFQVESELQLPSTEKHQANHLVQMAESELQKFCILFTGIVSGGALDGLNLIIRTIQSGKLSELGLKPCELHLYVPENRALEQRYNWEHDAIKIHGWVSQQELRSVLATADALFIPYSFSEDQKYFTSKSFPSKAADYLASGKPLLILAPPYASIVEYARKYNFAEIVDESSEEALVRGIYRLWKNPDYRERLGRNAIEVFKLNHDVVSQRIGFQQLVNHLADRASNAVASNVATSN